MQREILVIHESVLDSIVRDAVTFGFCMLGWEIGRLAGSSVLEAFFILVGILVAAILGSNSRSKNIHHVTPDEARDWLDANFPDLRNPRR